MQTFCVMLLSPGLAHRRFSHRGLVRICHPWASARIKSGLVMNVLTAWVVLVLCEDLRHVSLLTRRFPCRSRRDLCELRLRLSACFVSGSTGGAYLRCGVLSSCVSQLTAVCCFVVTAGLHRAALIGKISPACYLLCVKATPLTTSSTQIMFEVSTLLLATIAKFFKLPIRQHQYCRA